MSTTTNAALIRRIATEYWLEQRDEVMDGVFAPDFVNHSLPPGEASDAARTRAAYDRFRAAFSGPEHVIDHLVASDDHVSWVWTFTGTHTADYMGIPATGRRVSLTGITIQRFRDGKIVEQWSQSSLLGLMEQLGAGAERR